MVLLLLILLNGGGRVCELANNIPEGLLDTIDVVILDDMLHGCLDSDVAALREWILLGGRMILQADDEGSMVRCNQLLEGTGITESYGGFRDGVFTDIVSHPITQGVSRLSSNSYGSDLTVLGSAISLVFDELGNVNVAASSLGQGALIVMGNEYCGNDVVLNSDDNRLFANQSIDWLAGMCGNNWFSLVEDSVIVGAGEFIDVEVNFDARVLTSSGKSKAEERKVVLVNC